MGKKTRKQVILRVVGNVLTKPSADTLSVMGEEHVNIVETRAVENSRGWISFFCSYK